MKECPSCKEVKSKNAYYLTPYGTMRRYCIECTKKQCKERREKKKQEDKNEANA